MGCSGRGDVTGSGIAEDPGTFPSRQGIPEHKGPRLAADDVLIARRSQVRNPHPLSAKSANAELLGLGDAVEMLRKHLSGNGWTPRSETASFSGC
jgi:hypothetical protein